MRLSHDVVDRRDWAQNSNTISLDDDTVLDVPAAITCCSRYCATLGHKANHSSAPNARYDVFDHPLHGCIKCVRAIRGIAAGEEVTVDYGFDGVHGYPDWWQQQQQQQQQQRSNTFQRKRQRGALAISSLKNRRVPEQAAAAT